MAKRRRAFQFRPIHFIIVLTIDVCILAGMIIPQQARLRQASAQLAEREQALADIRLEFERESDKLEFMKTTVFRLQQGSEKYGWHYEEDVLIRDGLPEAAPGPTFFATPSPATPIPSESPQITSEPTSTPTPEPTETPYE